MNQPPVQPGDILAGKYEVERVLGAGGMGVVVAARHLQLRDRVALKFLLPDVMMQPEAVERFEREARNAVRIKGEHVARVSDVGTLDNGVPYMVVEYLDGVDLAHLLEKQGPFLPEEAIEYILQACEAMAEAHSLGIVHRDLKPSNLFLTRRPSGEALIKVLDFGISKSLMGDGDAPPPSLTTTNGVIGSPLYMSPEQVRNAKTVDARTDIWSLGVILYELIAGACPFDGRMVPEVIAKIAADPPVPLRARRPEIDARIEQIVLQCLEKNPAARFASVADLAAALLPFGGPRAQISMHRITANLPSLPPAAAVPVAASSQARSHHKPALESAETLAGTSTQQARSRRVAAGVVAVAALIAVAAAILIATLLRSAHSTTAATELPTRLIDSALAPVAAPAASAPPQASETPSATPPQASARSSPPAKTQPAVSSSPAKTTAPAAPATTRGIQDLINDRR
jgi:eukaryotic-like serine/threonine-protein kinase